MLSKWKGHYDNHRKFQKDWEREFSWLRNRDNSCYCQWCKCSLKGMRKSILENHAKTLKHKNRSEMMKGKIIVDGFRNKGSIGVFQKESIEVVQSKETIEVIQSEKCIGKNVKIIEEKIEVVPEFEKHELEEDIPVELAVDSSQELPDFLHDYAVYQFNDYINYRSPKLFWEEPYVLRIMDAVWKKEIRTKKAAEILGITPKVLHYRLRKKRLSWMEEAMLSNIELDFDNQTPPEAPSTAETPTPVISPGSRVSNNDANIRIIYGKSLDRHEKPERTITVDEHRQEDEFDALGKIVARKLRQADPQQKLFAERIIHEVLFQVQMGALNQNYSLRLS